MKISSFSCSLKNLKDKPNEDYCMVSRKYPIFTVADGVSRTKNPDGSYPDPSGAAMAAKLFCKMVMAATEEFFDGADVKSLRMAFFDANYAVYILNIRHGVTDKLDFLANDYFGTCGAAAFIKDGFLYYGYIGDCGLRIHNRNDLLRMVSIDDVAPLEEYRDSLPFESEAERMILWRMTLRNNPSADYLTYGVITGEPSANHYCHFGKIELFSGDIVFLYSDGFMPFIKKPEFRRLFKDFKGPELEQKISEFVELSPQSTDDKTLIAIFAERDRQG